MARSRRKKQSAAEKLLELVRRDGQSVNQRRQEADSRTRRFAAATELWGQLKEAAPSNTDGNNLPRLADLLVQFVQHLNHEQLLRHLSRFDSGEGDTELSRRAKLAVETFKMAEGFSANEMTRWLGQALAADPTTCEWFLEILTRRIPFAVLEGEWPSETREHVEAERKLELQMPVTTPSARHDETEPTPDGGRPRPVAGKRRRPTYERDHLWLSWYEVEGSDTFHSPAKIRDRWNREHPDEAIAGGAQGRDLVKKGILLAQREQETTGENS